MKGSEKCKNKRVRRKKYFYVKQVKESRTTIVAECLDRIIKKEKKPQNM